MIIKKQANGSTRASLELLYNISRELASALDLQALLRRILFLSMDNIGAANGSIIVLDDEEQALESIIVVGDKVHVNTTRQMRIILEGGLAGYVAKHRQAVLIPDTSLDERWMRRPDDDTKRTGPKSAMSAPLLVRDKIVGIMTLVHPSPGFFTPENLELLQAISDQAGIAVLNARLYNESQRQARVMTAVANSAAAITGALHLEEVLTAILTQTSQALDVKIVSLALIDPADQRLKYQASTMEKRYEIAGRTLEIEGEVIKTISQEGQGVILSRLHKDSLFSSAVNYEPEFEIPAVAYAPIYSNGKVIGLLEAVNTREVGFNPDAMLVLTGIADLAGSALRHARLFENLQAAHQRYLELFEDNIDPILITDWNRSILEANRQAQLTTGFNSSTLLNMTIDQIQTLDRAEIAEKIGLIPSVETVSYETQLVTHSGGEIPVEVYVREVMIDGVSHLQWILHDITEREELDNLRDDLISMIYHDLRSPLANVVSSLDVLDAILPEEEDPTIKSMITIAIRSTERIQRLTSSLLDISRLEAGQPVGNRQPISSLVLLEEAVDSTLPSINKKEQKLVQLMPTDLPLIKVDADMVRRVFINLLENASKFTPHGGTISIGAKKDGEFIMIWIKDTGPGIPAAEKERIFDKYARVHLETGPKGIGLGLAFCRLAVEAHGGRIWVDSQIGDGACFSLSFPCIID
jgi:two-component system, NtrC family, sensor histidine kinase KinB